MTEAQGEPSDEDEPAPAPSPDPSPADSPPVDPPPVPDPPPPSDVGGSSEPVDPRSAERRATFVVAVIAAVAALLGAAVGSTATIWAARTQVDAQVSQFVREERKELYAKALENLTAIQNVDSKSKGEIINAGMRGKLTLELTQGVSGRYSDALRELTNMQSQVTLLSSPRTKTAFENLLARYERVHARIVELILIMQGVDLAGVGISGAVAELVGTNPDPEADDRFIQAARDEIGVP